MDLTDRYIGLWLKADEAEVIFAFPPAGVECEVFLAAKIIGESPVGLWVQALVLLDVETRKDLGPSISKDKPVKLIRWEFIRSAELWEELELDPHELGFRPRWS